VKQVIENPGCFIFTINFIRIVVCKGGRYELTDDNCGARG
jgi:hypothetical protein